jgi:DNA-binding transcriptional ArsR family regulator
MAVPERVPRRDPAPPPDRPADARPGVASGAAAGRRGDRAAAASAATGELDRIVHERMRLGILSALAAGGVRTFNELKELLGATDGNVSVHARKLEDAGYVTCTKSFEGRVPRTEFTITPEGRRALDQYLDHMEALIRATRPR